MIWSTVWVEAVVFTALFTALVMIPTIKHPEIGVHNYPPDIQEEYFKTYEHVPVAPLSGRTIAFKGFGIVLFTVLLTYGAILAGADSFWTGAEFAAILFLIVGAWDMFFLDWVLFAHLKVFRLPGTEHMDKAYAQKWFHVKGMLFPGSFFENTRKPEGLGGKLMLAMMNVGHRALADWGLQFAEIAKNARVLDCGCGGGANIRTMLKKCPNGEVKGVDYSPVSVEKAKKVNEDAILNGRCVILQGNVADLIFAANQFDLVTAFETIYFWPDLLQSFREVHRVLKPDGMFLICNECGGDNEKDEKWTEKIDGMTIYKDVQLKNILEQTGFRNIQIHKSEKGWLCITAQK